MQREETLREIAALRHNLHINSRLRLEFLASISKLLRDYGISADDQLLSSLILAVPDELSARSDSSTRMARPDDEPQPPTPPDGEPQPPAPPDGEPQPPTPPDDEPQPPIPPRTPE